MNRIEIDSDLVVSIWFGEAAEFPVLIQPTKPDGSAWKNKAEAQAWAESYIAEVEAQSAQIEVFAETPIEASIEEPAAPSEE